MFLANNSLVTKMKLKGLLITFSLLFSLLILFPYTVSAQNWITFSYPNFNSRDEFAWKPLDKDYTDNWQAKIYNYLSYADSYVGVYGAEVGFYNESRREAGTVGVAISFTKAGIVDVIWFDGSGQGTINASGYWSMGKPVVVTVRNGSLSVGDPTYTEKIIKDFPCGTWTMNSIGVKGDAGLTKGGYVSVTLDFVPTLEDWRLLNADPYFRIPSEDESYYNPHVSPSGLSNETISAAGGFVYIRFSPGKMTLNILNPSSGPNQFGTLVAGVFHESLQSWFFHEGDKRLPSSYRIRVDITIKVLNVSSQAEWLRAGVAVGFALRKNELQRFVELDFFRKNQPVGVTGSSEVVVIPFANVSVGEKVSLELDMTRYLDEYLDRWFHLKDEDYKVWGVWLAVETINSAMALEVYEFRVLYAPKEEYRYAFVNDWDFEFSTDDVANRKWKPVGWPRPGRQSETHSYIKNGKAYLRIRTLEKTSVDTVAFAQGNEPHQGVNLISKLLASNTKLADAVEVTDVVIKKNETSSWSGYYFFYPKFRLTKKDVTTTEGINSAWGEYPGYTFGFGLETQHEYYDPTDGKYHLSDYWNTDMHLGGYGKPWLAAATYTDVLMIGEYYVPSEGWKVWRGPGTGQFSSEYTDTMSVQYHGIGEVADVEVWYTLRVNLSAYWNKIFSDVQQYWNSCAQALDLSPSQYPILTSLVLRQYALYLEGTAVDVATEVEYIKMENSREDYELYELSEEYNALAEELGFFKNVVYALTVATVVSVTTTIYYMIKKKRKNFRAASK